MNEYDTTVDALMQEYEKLCERNRLLSEALLEAGKYARTHFPAEFTETIIKKGYLPIFAGGLRRDPEGTEFVTHWLHLASQKPHLQK